GLQRAGDALAPGGGDGVGDQGSMIGQDVGGLGQVHAHQIAQIGYDPLLARGDEPVAVEQIDILPDRVQLALHQRGEGAQRLAELLVAEPEDVGQEPVEALALVRAHDASWMTSRDGSMTKIWAGRNWPEAAS